jgi:hypothetical protein
LEKSAIRETLAAGAGQVRQPQVVKGKGSDRSEQQQFEISSCGWGMAAKRSIIGKARDATEKRTAIVSTLTTEES